MRLIFLKYQNKDKHPLNGFEQSFRSPTNLNNKIDPLSLVGINGSGKSKLLEALAEVFNFLHAYFGDILDDPDKNIPLGFHIEYALRVKDKWQFVKALKTADGLEVETGLSLSDLQPVLEKLDVKKLLPTITGYSSGENENLSTWFRPYSDEYAEYYQSQVFQGGSKKSLPPLPDFLWLDFSMNKKVFIANALLSDNSKWRNIKKETKIESLHSFRINIQLKPRTGPSNGIIPAPEQEEIIKKLQRCSTLSKREEKRNRLTLDFYICKATIDSFKHEFKDTYNLYLSLNQLDLLNHVLIRNQIKEAKRLLKDSGENIPIAYPFEDDRAFSISHILLNGSHNSLIFYKELSDGEHQFLHVFGSLLMVHQNNTLFLMDEPETHFNPQWRSAFISLMSKVVYGRYQEFLITTHSPFILSDSKKENVFVFERKSGQIQIKRPDFQTYGAAIDNLLQMAFGISPPVALKSRKEIKELVKDDDLTSDELEAKIDNYGDSVEKMNLYQKLYELKEKEERNAKKS